MELAGKAFAELRDHGGWLTESEPKHSWFAPLVFDLIESTLTVPSQNAIRLERL
jgi:hypothetical protein